MTGRFVVVLAVLLISLGLSVASLEEPRAAASPTPTIRETSSPSPTVEATATPVAEPSAVSPPPTPRAIPDGYRIVIPRLRIDLPIHEGDVTRDVVNEQTPEHAAFHFPGTFLPGDGSNTFIYAHARTGMFLSLWAARVGDEVIIVAPGGAQLHYVVSEVHPRSPPDETSWLEPTASERLTLQTSTGPRSNDPRFIVVALPRAT